MASDDFVGGVRLTAERHGMDLGRPLVLVSGGPDSVALLRAVVALGGEPAVLHVDHGLRGGESGRDAGFVRRLCDGLGVRCEIAEIDLSGTSNLQERARDERYRLAREVAARFGLRVVATGHTADDVAETVILNLARGTGMRGLAGIPPVRGGIVRPLIERTRQEVLRYLAELDQPYRTDSTNLSAKYARNRVRLEVLPVLEKLHPGAARNLARAASTVREDLAALEGLAAAAVEERGGEAVLARGALQGLPPALRRHAVRAAYSKVLPGAPPPEFRHVEAVLALRETGSGTRLLDLPGGVVAAARGDGEISFYLRAEPLAGEQVLDEGETSLGGWEIHAEEVARFDAGDAARPGVAYLDASLGPYRVRAVREGDMIRPLGLGGTKKVLRAMMDRKVPKDVRRRTPVVVDRLGEVAWVPFGELGEGFGVKTQTGRILKVEVAKSPWTCPA
ncbi:tRNA lysidine(34) synthetase TilS [Rubrobacter tropicus]|uniref:tRNA(Ile)-lysidine synthase n=1 Tax=Rubrobacter tropicus TaxID=2653851 RepID=A0A6G8QB31_9ACTN|nr:tRNA lysidine(34) synthetase TilS [Rubrobacter tropicus]QIN83686.1 tRNA lysidine(34) synthetase TilS [Rubrobacter tropicus]